MAGLARRKPDWVPANQVHGEGIFIQFDEPALRTWEAQVGVLRMDGMLRAGHGAWRTSRHLDPNEGYPSIRYAMLHTLSHLLIRELALECGYNAASIRERIYANGPSAIRRRVSSSTRQPLILMGRWAASSISASPRTSVGCCGRR
jgi:hypothetical protein